GFILSVFLLVTIVGLHAAILIFLSGFLALALGWLVAVEAVVRRFVVFNHKSKRISSILNSSFWLAIFSVAISFPIVGSLGGVLLSAVGVGAVWSRAK